MSEKILEMKGIKKQFFENVVLDGVEFSLEKGEVHALIGANGAGKSTLIKILNGIYTAEAGTIVIEGREATIRHPSDAEKYGISFVHQELNVCPDLSVAENIFIGNLQTSKAGFYDKRKTIEKAQQLIDKMQIEIDAAKTVRNLRAAEKQIIEILKAMTTNSKIMVLDEPTSSLTEKEKIIFFQLINNLKEQGVSIIFISHFLEDILQITDRVTALRDGHNSGFFYTKEIKKETMIEAMMGKSIVKRADSDKHNKVAVEDALVLKGFSSDNKFADINLTVKAGMIMGVCGLLGAGKSEIARAIYGLDDYDEGTIHIYGKELKHQPPVRMLKQGVALLTEDRKIEGFSPLLSIEETITMSMLERLCSKLGFVHERKRRQFSQEMTNKMTVKCDSVQQKISELSGGNQQKVIIGRCVASTPKLFMLDEPTRGVDVYAKMEIYNILKDMATEGVAVLIFSSELEELIEVCDSITVLKSGRIIDTVDPTEISKSELFAKIS